jgi:signal transduction histidine kinase/ActR/RegA family two-component response regulator
MRPSPVAVDPLRPILIVGGVCVVITASLVAGVYTERLHDRAARGAAAVQARILADTVTAALSFGDRPALREYVNATRADPALDAAGVYDNSGRLVAGFTRSRLAQRLADTLNPVTAAGRIIVKIPVAQGGSPLGTVYLRERTEPFAQRLSRYAPAGLLVLMGLAMFLMTTLDAQALRRINRDLQVQIAQRERAEAALRQSQKMEAIGRLTGGIAHDFNNMLAIVLGSLDLLLRRYADADAKLLRLAAEAREGANRAAVLTQRLLAFSRLQPLKPASADITRTVNNMAVLLRRTLGETISVQTVSAGGLWRAHIDAAELETSILNLAINARDAMPDGGKLTIETGNAYLDRAYADAEPDVTPGQYVMVAITDTGTGIPPETLSQVFEPFFTTKPTGQGTGLGLSQVLGFIKQSGGHVRLYSEVGVGTTVKLYLPRSLTDHEPPPAQVAISSAKERRHQTVLVVEDEPGVRNFVIEALSDLGYDVISAERPSVALDQLEAHPEVAVLLTDVVMPEMNGRVLAERARRRRPFLRVVFMTGYTRNAIVHNGTLDPGTHLVSKPFTVAQLGAELDAALASSSPE